MGIHYVNGDLVGDGKLDVSRPEALMYEPRNGKLELVGVEYIVLAAAWDLAYKTPPTLVGQLFHYTPSPNRYGIPAFYALHVWAWRHNPHGVFMDWNPRVSCSEYMQRVHGGPGSVVIRARLARLAEPRRAAGERCRHGVSCSGNGYWRATRSCHPLSRALRCSGSR